MSLWLRTVKILFFLAPVICSAQASDKRVVEFYANLPRVAAMGLPSPNDMIPPIEEGIARADAGTISQAIPYMIADLSATDSRVRALAVMGFTLIGTRVDGASFVSQTQSRLLEILNDPDNKIATEMAYGFSFVKPSLPDSLVAPLLVYLRSPGTGERAAPAVAATLLSARPGDLTISAGVAEALRSPKLSNNARASFLRAVSSPTYNELIVDAVRQVLRESSDHSVQLSAIGVFRVMGPRALTRAVSELEAISSRVDTQSDVKVAAGSSLRGVKKSQ